MYSYLWLLLYIIYHVSPTNLFTKQSGSIATQLEPPLISEFHKETKLIQKRVIRSNWSIIAGARTKIRTIGVEVDIFERVLKNMNTLFLGSEAFSDLRS